MDLKRKSEIQFQNLGPKFKVQLVRKEFLFRLMGLDVELSILGLQVSFQLVGFRIRFCFFLRLFGLWIWASELVRSSVFQGWAPTFLVGSKVGLPICSSNWLGFRNMVVFQIWFSTSCWVICSWELGGEARKRMGCVGSDHV